MSRKYVKRAGSERVTVHSKTYGEHTRAPRGSKSAAEVNDELKKHSALLIGANGPARLVKQAIDEFRGDFPCGQLWQYLVGMFKKQLKMQYHLDVNDLQHTDISKDYRFSRIAKGGFSRQINVDTTQVTVSIPDLKPTFRRTGINGFRLEAMLVLFDFKAMEFTSDTASSSIIPLKHDSQFSHTFKSGRLGDSYIVCLKLSGCIGTEILTDNAANSIQIIDAGRIQDPTAET